MRLINRRRGLMGRVSAEPDIYENCVTLEFTETTDNHTRKITENHANVTTYLDAIIIDGVSYAPTKAMTHSFSAGTHKIGWKFKTTVIYSNVLGATSPYQSFSSDLSLVTIPSQITEIKSMAMRGMPAYRPLRGVICYAVNPPTAVDLSVTNWYLVQSGNSLSVPSQSVDAYKAAEGWSQYADRIQAIPE